MRILLLSISLFVSAPAVLIEYTLTDEECLEAGFIRKDLKCAYCKELRKFQLEMIMTDCFACCTKDPEDEHPKLSHLNLRDRQTGTSLLY
ncbi:hypothetical protein COOONC_12035 [Cooperia oncophora]